MRRNFLQTLAGSLLLGSAGGLAAPAWAGDEIKVVYHLADGNDQAEHALANIRNHLRAAPDTKIVVVALGEGIRFLLDGATEHSGKPFFPELVEFITRGPLVAMVLEGESAIAAARQVIGATNPLEAVPGSIRGDFALEITFNLVHGSDSPNSAVREVEIFFPELGEA